MASTGPDRDFGIPSASPDSAARAAAKRIEWVGLTLASASLPVWAIDLDDLHVVFTQQRGQPGAVRAGALDTDFDNRPVGRQPRDELAIAHLARRELAIPKHPADPIDRGCMVGLAVGVDAAIDVVHCRCHAELAVPSEPEHGRHAPAGRADKTVMGPLARLL